MKNWIIQNKLAIIGAMVGAVAGYLYWQHIGCSSGTCAITSKPMNSTAYFAMMGALVFSMFKPQNAKKEERNSLNQKEEVN